MQAVATQPAAGAARARKEMFLVLEGLRGLCAILVTMRHLGELSAPVCFPVSYLAVDIFFMLSGFVIAYSYEPKLLEGRMTVRSFMALRLIRLYPLYVVGSVLGVMALVQEGAYTVPQMLGIGVLSAMFLPVVYPGVPFFPFNQPGWSLFYELVMNLAYAKGVVKRSKKWLYALMAVSAGLLGLWVFSGGGHDLEVGYKPATIVFGLARVALPFIVGMLIYRAFMENPPEQRHGNLMGILLCVLVMEMLMLPFESTFMAGLFSLAFVFGILPVVLYHAVRVRITWPWLGWVMMALGAVSYPIYVLHYPVYLLMKHSGGQGWNWLVAHAPYSGMAITAVLVVVAYVMDKAFDIPARKWLRAQLVRG